MESPSSWLTRVAFRQVVSPRELTRQLGVSMGTDCDTAFSKLSFQAVAARHTSAVGAFGHVDLMLGRLRKIDPSGDRFLLRRDAAAFHRFCAACLAADRVKYFRLEWRFKCWRWCPAHSCLLLENCPHCGGRVTLPQDMCRAGADGQGVASLDRCLHCTERLTTNWEDTVRTLDSKLITPWEQALLNNGRAALAALAVGRLRVQGESKAQGFIRLRAIEKQGFLPHASRFGLTHEEMMRRRVQERIPGFDTAAFTL